MVIDGGAAHNRRDDASAPADLLSAEVAVVGLAEVTGAYKALGRLLAERRQAAGLTQAGLAGLVPWSRSTIGSVELGQAARADFWADCDAAVGADGALLAGARRAMDLAGRYRAAAKRTGQDAGGRAAQPGTRPRSSAAESVGAEPSGRPSVLNLSVPAGASVTIAFEGAGTAGQSWRVMVSAPADLADWVDETPTVTDSSARLYSMDAGRERSVRRRGSP